MRPTRIELEGFLSYRDRVELDLSDVGAAAILGPNGSGKTTLVEAIGWALFGEGRGRGPDDYVNPESTRAMVGVELDVGGRHYAVMRERVAGRSARSALHLTIYDLLGEHENGEQEFGWRSIGHPNIVDTQRAIVDLLGMTFETWESTSFVGQGKADAFTRRRPAERKALLAEVLELDRYGRLSELARVALGEAKGQADGLRSERTLLQSRTDQREEVARDLYLAEELRDQLAGEMTRRQADAEEATASAVRALERVSASRAAMERVGAARARLEAVRAEHDGLSLEADRLTEIVADAGPAQADAEAANATAERALAGAEECAAEAEDRGKAVAMLEERLRTDEARHAELGERTDKLARLGAVCPTCEQPIEREVHDRLLREVGDARLKAIESVEDARMALDGHRAAIEKLRQDEMTFSSEASTATRRIEEATRRIEEANRALDDLQRITDRYGPLEQTILELDAEITALGDLPNTAEAENAAQTARMAANGAHDRVEQTMRELAGASSKVGVLSERMRQIEEAEAALERNDALLDEAFLTLEVAELAAKAFGRDGIPALLIETAIPEIEAAANELLDLLTGGRLTVALETLGAKRTGGVRETLDIVVGDDVSERPLEALSGGERQMVDLSLRIALSRLLAGRRGRKIETLIVDEAFTELDEAHRQRAVGAFASLGSAFPTMIVVTHLADLAEAFGTRFVVERAGGTSTVRREG